MTSAPSMAGTRLPNTCAKLACRRSVKFTVMLPSERDGENGVRTGCVHRRGGDALRMPLQGSDVPRVRARRDQVLGCGKACRRAYGRERDPNGIVVCVAVH